MTTPLAFVDDVQPAEGRPSEPNPYTEFVASVIARRLTEPAYAPSVVIPAAVDTEDVKSVRRFLAKASNAAGVSGRIKVTEVTKAGKAGTKLQFWTVPKITRKPTSTPAQGLGLA